MDTSDSVHARVIVEVLETQPLNFEPLPRVPVHPDLEKIFTVRGSDKTTVHSYHVPYSYVRSALQHRHDLRILEVGVGSRDPAIPGFMGVNAVVGASLFSWRDLFPDAEIVGCDIDPAASIKEEHIQTFTFDQLHPEKTDQEALELLKPGFDLVVDDGLHDPRANRTAMGFLWSFVRPGGFYVVEDIESPFISLWSWIVGADIGIHAVDGCWIYRGDRNRGARIDDNMLIMRRPD